MHSMLHTQTQASIMQTCALYCTYKALSKQNFPCPSGVWPSMKRICGGASTIMSFTARCLIWRFVILFSSFHSPVRMLVTRLGLNASVDKWQSTERVHLKMHLNSISETFFLINIIFTLEHTIKAQMCFLWYFFCFFHEAKSVWPCMLSWSWTATHALRFTGMMFGCCFW